MFLRKKEKLIVILFKISYNIFIGPQPGQQQPASSAFGGGSFGASSAATPSSGGLFGSSAASKPGGLFGGNA